MAIWFLRYWQLQHFLAILISMLVVVAALLAILISSLLAVEALLGILKSALLAVEALLAILRSALLAVEVLFVCFDQCQFSTKIPRSLSRAEVARASGLLTRGKLYLSCVVGSYIARAYNFLFRIVYRTTARRC